MDRSSWRILIGVVIVILAILAWQNYTPQQESRELALNEQDLAQLGMSGDNCTTERYQTGENSPLGEYTFCKYEVNGLNNTEVIIELKRFANFDDLNGSYQYDSLHLYSVQGLISENTYGDQSRFRVNNENDYGGQYNEPGVYYYHLWIVKNDYLIHITSAGNIEAKQYIEKTGQLILSKFV